MPPTATPTPPATSATVAFTSKNQDKSVNPSLAGCTNGSGCDWADNPENVRTNVSTTIYFSSSRQVALGGNLTVTAVGPDNFNCPSSSYYCIHVYWQNGPGWADCGWWHISLAANASTSIYCQLGVSSPSSIAAGSFMGTCYACGVSRRTDLSWHNPNSFYWLAKEGESDCDNSIQQLTSASQQPGGANYNAWQSAVSGLTVAIGPGWGSTNWTCVPQWPAYTQSFTASGTATAEGLAFNPSKPQAAATSKLNAVLDNGDHWVSQQTCAVNVTAVNMNWGNPNASTMTVDCAPSGISGQEAFTWVQSLKDGLAQALAGQSLAAALAQCNADPEVQPGSCQITLSGGSTLPSDWHLITVAANDPPKQYSAPLALTAAGRETPTTHPPAPPASSAWLITEIALGVGFGVGRRRLRLSRPRQKPRRVRPYADRRTQQPTPK